MAQLAKFPRCCSSEPAQSCLCKRTSLVYHEEEITICSLLVKNFVEDEGGVLAVDEVPLGTARRHKGEGLVILARVVRLEPVEEEAEEVALLEARREVLHAGVVEKQLKER